MNEDETTISADDHIPECPQKTNPEATCQCEVDGIFCICVICRRAMSKTDVVGRETCPECETRMRPLHPNQEVAVKVNWMELTTLAAWAEQYASAYQAQFPDMLKAVYSITSEMEEQYPLKAPLTVGRELGILKAKNPHMPTIGAIEPIPPKWRLQ